MEGGKGGKERREAEEGEKGTHTNGVPYPVLEHQHRVFPAQSVL